jgi:hypothetical protein
MSAIDTVNHLTTEAVDGTGVFDALMRTVDAHLESQFQKSRITGASYAQTYLGAMQAAMSTSLEFLVRKEVADLEADLLTQKILTEGWETQRVEAAKCKLDAEFDVLEQTVIKVQAETSLLNQKRTTEAAQTVAANVDPDSVIGKQRTLYQRQADGFLRDAEQKATKIMVDSWNVRRTTDSGVVADATNRLDDANIGNFVQQLLAGVTP